jgi:hypothetical protein
MRMSAMSLMGQISEKVKSFPLGTVFVASNFNDPTDNEAIRQSLSLLEKRALFARTHLQKTDSP